MRRVKSYAWGICLFCLLLLLLAGTAGADTKKIEGTTNVEDSYIEDGSPNENNGGENRIRIHKDVFWLFIRVKNVASELGVGATDITAVCSLQTASFATTGTPTISAYRVFKPWVEGTQIGGGNPPGVTWNEWDNSAEDEYEWTTAGCECANDDGVDNSADDGACDDPSRRDRKATAEDIVEVTADNTWYSWDISTELATGWYNGTIEEEGIRLHTDDANEGTAFYSTEATSYHPFFVFTYTTEEPPAAGQVIIIGARDEENYHNPRLGIPPVIGE